MLTLSAYLTIFLLTYDAKCALKFMPFLCDCKSVAVYLLMSLALVAVPDELNNPRFLWILSPRYVR